jgi:NADPH:quinone reductase-like Zn-dependent oxidoreductase
LEDIRESNQLAKHFGAHVTGVCSTSNLELVKSLGADKVIDYTKEDFTGSAETYDIIVDTAGTAPFSRCAKSLKQEGRLLLVLGDLPAILHAPWVAMTSKKRVIAGPAAGRAEDLRLLAQLAKDGQLKPVIEQRYPLERIAEAHRLVDSGRKKGNVVISLRTDTSP